MIPNHNESGVTIDSNRGIDDNKTLDTAPTSARNKAELPAPASYFPWHSGRYQVTPNLFGLHTDFGNGEVDHECFQFDRDFVRYRANKIQARQEDWGKYVCGGDFTPDFRRCLNRFFVATLTKEHAEFFSLSGNNRYTEVQCRLTGDTLVFDTRFDYDAAASCVAVTPPYADGFDALAMQFQEDIAVVELSANTDCVTALHLCAPNHWSPAEKLGKSFVDIHQPVAGMDAVNNKVRGLLNALLHRGPYVRFAWGLATDRRLNHHPVPPTGTAENDWAGRHFDGENPKLFMRVERQTLHGLAEFSCVLFTIRTYFYDLDPTTTSDEQRDKLISAIESMSLQQLRYKGLFTQYDAILTWLNEGYRASTP